MHVIVKHKETFRVSDHYGVKNIAYANGTYTLTLSNDTTQTYAIDSYYVILMII